MTEEKSITRRYFFEQVQQGIFGAALVYLLSRDIYGASTLLAAETGDEGHESRRRTYDLKPRPPAFEPRAKAVIQLFMNGGPSHVDLFDPKPMLEKHHGKPYLDKSAPADLQAKQQDGALLRSPFQFAQHGQSGIWLSEVLPYLARQVDDIAVIRSMVTSSPDHFQGVWKMLSGRTLPGLPDPGSVGHLRVGQPKPKPSGLCRAERSAGTSHHRDGQLAGGLSAPDLPGNAYALHRIAPVEPASRGGAAAADGRAGAGPDSAAGPNPQTRASQTTAARCPPRQLRAGGPPAARSQRRAGYLPRRASRPWRCTGWGKSRFTSAGSSRSRGRILMRGGASWPGDWSSAACALCRSA